ncbi:MAG: magnesium transporter [Deltaproteobacteria bacterium]|nr:magnesium transporter [Deltaproteobacteria bacterium]
MAVEGKILPVEEIKDLYGRGDTEGIKRLIAPLHPTDIARLFEGLDEAETVRVFRLLHKGVAASVLLELDSRVKEFLVSSVSAEELAQIVGEMESDDAADIVAELPLKEAKEVLDGIEKKEAVEVEKLLKYPEDTAGGKMQAELVSVREDVTVRDTIEEARRRSKEVENFSSLFVVDSRGAFVGTVPLERLILADEDQPIKDITDTKALKVTTDVDQEEVAKMFRRYDLLSMPVVDRHNRLVGRITVDDVVDVIEEEIFEDFYRMAGLNVEERVFDPARRSIWMRFPWLLANLGTAFLAASVVGIFRSTIEGHVVLAVFMPIVAGMGGNAATQTITVVVRGLALGEMAPKTARWVLRKEGLVGLANGVLTGIVATFLSYIFGVQLMIGVLLFLAMIINLLIAGLSGAFIPLVLRWFKVDPALSATIFVTTCTDIGGFFAFLGLASVFMKIGLL